jgi:aspartate ammonia-lyase
MCSRWARTVLQDAVARSSGQEFGAWAQAVAARPWRLYKAEERLRQVGHRGHRRGPPAMNAPGANVFTVIERPCAN